MKKSLSAYQPISCDLHDRLEELSTLRKRTLVRYRGEDGVARERHALITDVFSLGGAEYLQLDSGEALRLDQVVEVCGVAC